MPSRGSRATFRVRTCGHAPGTLAERAYARIKRLILTPRVLPGDRLLHRVLVDRLQMSSTPVREGMSRLIQEGYIRHVPNVGYFVREIDPAEAEHLYEAREVLETQTAALAAVRHHPAEMDRVERASRAFRRAIGRRPHKSRVLLDMRFHLTIARLARNPFLLGALESLLYRIAVTRNVERFAPEHNGLQADLAHRQILEALRSKNPEGAREAMRHHLLRSKAIIVRELEESSRREP